MIPSDLFDEYARNAPLQPALLLLFPLFLTVAIWLPALYTTAAGFVGLAVACGVTVFFAHVARERGRRAERRLFALWGGKPTTIWLRRNGSDLDEQTRARYCAFLCLHVPAWKEPTVEEEQADAAGADRRYETAVKWLLEFARDKRKFVLVFKENVSYGFRRNFYGLKPLGIVLDVICTALNAICLFAAKPIDPAGVASLVVSCAALLTWLTIVRPGWVRDAADGYARALLAACESVPTRRADTGSPRSTAVMARDEAAE